MTKLSPQAQAVKDAVLALYPDKATQSIGWPLDIPTIAGALRAAADQVVPEPSAHLPEQNCRWYRLGVSAYRHNLLAIADELEGNQ
jgi:hypothetical protein